MVKFLIGEWVVEFEWDPKKATTNEKKHGISFSEATCPYQKPHPEWFCNFFTIERIKNRGPVEAVDDLFRYSWGNIESSQ